MKILLTGEPKSGKSTMLAALLNCIDHKKGILTEEVVDDAGRRTGFRAISSMGDSQIIAGSDRPTEIKVGRFYVYVDKINSIAKSLLENSGATASEVLYIDEIGKMQLHSNDFKKLITDYVHESSDFIGTITSVWNDEFINDVKKTEGIIVISIDEENRELIRKALIAYFENRSLIDKLSKDQQEFVKNKSASLLHNERYLSFYKLFNNSIGYVIKNKVTEENSSQYVVEGEHDNHIVSVSGRSLSCDCKMYKGELEPNEKGECSHIYAVKIINI